MVATLVLVVLVVDGIGQWAGLTALADACPDSARPAAHDRSMPETPTDRYTHGHHRSVLAVHRSRTAEDSAAYLLPHLLSGQRLLGLGCGPGTITVGLAEFVGPGEVIALDREPAIVEEAARAAMERRQDNVTVTVGDVYALEFAAAAFDVVLAHQLLQHLSDPVAALREMRRVAKPDGLVAVRDADYAAMTWYPHEPRLDRWMEIYQAVARANGAEPDAGRRLLAWLVKLASNASNPRPRSCSSLAARSGRGWPRRGPSVLWAPASPSRPWRKASPRPRSWPR